VSGFLGVLVLGWNLEVIYKTYQNRLFLVYGGNEDKIIDVNVNFMNY
jgi:hypothetical protein